MCLQGRIKPKIIKAGGGWGLGKILQGTISGKGGAKIGNRKSFCGRKGGKPGWRGGGGGGGGFSPPLPPSPGFNLGLCLKHHHTAEHAPG